MRARVAVLVTLAVVVVGGGLLTQWLAARRHESARVGCLNNLRVQAQAAADVFDRLGRLPPELRKLELPGAVPAGTVPNPAWKPDERLSWIADTLATFEQKAQPTAELAGRVDRAAKWDAGRNADVGLTRLKPFTCPADVPDTPADHPAVAQYVGLAGVGPDAAAILLEWKPPPAPGERPLLTPTSPKAGCFRYDMPTPLDAIHRHDGLDNTLMIAEVSADLGPWIRGGPSTVRGLEDGAGVRPPVGFGGQFGGNHQHGITAVAYASGAAKFLTPRVSPPVFRAMTTMAGGDGEGVLLLGE